MSDDDPKTPKSAAHCQRHRVTVWVLQLAIVWQHLREVPYGLAVVFSLPRTLHNSVPEDPSFCAQTVANGCYLQSVDWVLDLYAVFMAAPKAGVHKFFKNLGCTSAFLCVPEGWHKIPYRGHTDIRRRTNSSRRGELAPGILALLVRGAFALECRQEGWFLVQ